MNNPFSRQNDPFGRRLTFFMAAILITFIVIGVAYNAFGFGPKPSRSPSSSPGLTHSEVQIPSEYVSWKVLVDFTKKEVR